MYGLALVEIVSLEQGAMTIPSGTYLIILCMNTMQRSMSLKHLRRLPIAFDDMSVGGNAAISLSVVSSVHLRSMGVVDSGHCRISRNFVSHFGDRALQSVQLVAKHVELGLAEGDITPCCRGRCAGS